jgi:hypothetical protein
MPESIVHVTKLNPSPTPNAVYNSVNHRKHINTHEHILQVKCMKLALFLIKYNTIKTYGGVEIFLDALLTSGDGDEWSQLHALDPLPMIALI